MTAFSKMHGLGNDFMVINNLDRHWQPVTDQIVAWADRHRGIGFDQLLVIEPATGSAAGADFSYRIFNADGGEVEQCGNGLRCFARFVFDQGLTRNTALCVETVAGLYYPKLLDNGDVEVDMGEAQFAPEQIPFMATAELLEYPLQVDDESFTIGAVAIGNPHAVLLVDDVDRAPVNKLGPLISKHPDFPNGVNVGFMQVVNRQQIRLRVFERGVGETLACGTGACAAAIIANRWGLTDRKIAIELRGGRLQIEWDGTTVRMAGPATHVYDGTIES
ncbi:MAG: diaminopimelate epimerase [Gammaproteobacteria bacterium]|nr:MAG: diaminopimelate epimerase [Gammaproteobacteria bacterium]RLA14621.1 MAG: diaminopimelate epimerase [Gammaproteobacteria bacterium]